MPRRTPHVHVDPYLPNAPRKYCLVRSTRKVLRRRYEQSTDLRTDKVSKYNPRSNQPNKAVASSLPLLGRVLMEYEGMYILRTPPPYRDHGPFLRG